MSVTLNRLRQRAQAGRSRFEYSLVRGTEVGSFGPRSIWQSDGACRPVDEPHRKVLPT